MGYPLEVFRTAAGFSDEADPARAARDAAARALGRAGLERVDGALVLATVSHASGLERLLVSAAEALGTRALAGALVARLHAGGREAHASTGVAVLALGGVAARSLPLPPGPGWEARLGEELASHLGAPPAAHHLAALFVDPAGLAPASFLAGLDASLDAAHLVGVGAATAGGRACVWAGSEIQTGGGAALLLQLPRSPRVAVYPGWRVLDPRPRVTRVEGHWICELDGRPALDVYRDVARGPLAGDLRRAVRVLLVGLERPGVGEAVCNVAGFDARRRAFAVPEPVPRGERVLFALRDPNAARDALKRTLDGLASPATRGLLHFGCSAESQGLLGVAGLEAAYVARAFGENVVAGASGPCQIVHAEGSARLLTHAGVLVALDA